MNVNLTESDLLDVDHLVHRALLPIVKQLEIMNTHLAAIAEAVEAVRQELRDKP